MVDETNPWSAEGWNVTKQAQYFRAYGPDRAAARARDAGTTLGGKRPGGEPMLRPWAAPTYIVRREVIQLVAAPPSSLSTVGSVHPLIGVDMNLQLLREYELTMSAVLGANMAAFVTLELDLEPVAAAFGLDMSSVVQLEKDFILTNSLGVDMAAALYREANPNASFTLGVDMSTSLDLSSPAVLFAASAALGVDMTAVISRQFNAIASNSVGVTMAASLLTLEQDFTSSPTLGINAAAALVLQRNLAASAALGIDMAAALSRTAQITAHPLVGVDMLAAITRIRTIPATTHSLGVTMAAAMSTSSPLTASFTDSFGSSTTVSSPATFTAKNFGTANANRWIIVCLARGNNLNSVLSCTIGGVAATVAESLPTTSGNNGTIFYAKVPTGATGNIVFTFSSPQNTIAVGVWSVVSPSGNLALLDAQGTATTSTTPSLTLVTQADGLVIACGINGNPQTWTGMTLEQDVAFNVRMALGHTITGAGVTSQTIGMSNSGASAMRAMAASFTA